MADQPASGSGGTGKAWNKIGFALASLVPPGALGAGLWPEARSHPWLSFGMLVSYWLVLGLMAIATGVGSELKAMWVPRLATAIDRVATAAVAGHHRQYLRRLHASVRDIEMMGVATQGEYVLQLQQVYVDVSLAPRPVQSTSTEPFVGRFTAPGERRTLDWFLQRSDRQVFAVIGGPGSGKTTLLRRTVLDRRRSFRRRGMLPVLLYLRDHAPAILSERPMGLAEIAAEVSWLQGRVPVDWIRRRLDRGKCLVMLDGLDEVANKADRSKVVAWIRRQIQQFPDNDYVITSRPLGYLSNPLTNANVLQVRRFTGDQISAFLHNWYYAIECRAVGEQGDHVRSRAATQANDLLRRLRGQSALYDLAANPLLLTMIANVHRYRGELPGTRAALYGEMCGVLLHRRQEAKGIADTVTKLRGEQKERVVGVLALEMMNKRIRDISERDAGRIIAPVLRRVTKENVSSQTFLREVHKSGLLVEREHGVYAFAHLTLQEYLAAAQIRERQRGALLGGMVEDAWWRETILLWASGADATPVVEACLKAGTVQALALAYDCSGQAREISPGTRRALEELLAAVPKDSAHERLLTAVRVARSLREIVVLGESTAIIANPVTNDIYALFVRAEQARNLIVSHDSPSRRIVVDNAPAVGMSARDAARFIKWVNGLFDDGATYRLLDNDELADPAVGMVVDLARHSIWADSTPYPRLYCPPGVTHPYKISREQLRRIPSADRRRTASYLRVALDLGCALGLANIIKRARDLASVITDRPLPRNLDLDLDLAGDLAYDLDLCIRIAGNLNFGSRLLRDLTHARSLVPAIKNRRDRTAHAAPSGIQKLAGSIDDVLGENQEASGCPSRSNRNLVKALEGVFGSRQDLVRMLANVRDLDENLEITLETDHDTDLALKRYLDLVDAISPDRDLDFIIEQDLTADLRPTLAQGRTDREMVSITAYYILVAMWRSSRDRKHKDAPSASFDDFLQETLCDGGEPRFVRPERIGDMLQLLSKLVRRQNPKLKSYEEWHELALCVADRLPGLALPTLESAASYDGEVASCIRIGLLAIGAVARRFYSPSDGEILTLLATAMTGLAALDERTSGGITANEVLILARA